MARVEPSLQKQHVLTRTMRLFQFQFCQLKKRQQWQMLNPFMNTHTIHQNSNYSYNHDDFWTRWHKKSGTHSSLDTGEIQSAKCAILCSGNKTRHQKPQLLLCCVGPVWLNRAIRSAVGQSNSWREDHPSNTLQIYEYKMHWDKRDLSLGVCVYLPLKSTRGR